jgi:predicted HAD superfamily hydrolase
MRHAIREHVQREIIKDLTNSIPLRQTENMNSIYNIITKKINDYEVISFDIFDTLIIRPYLKPKDVFRHIERILKLENFAKKRIQAELKARKTIQADEITFEEIYQNIGNKYKEAYQFEIDFEKRVCHQNPEIHAIYKYAVEQQKRIVFVSDMYLPEQVIKDILQSTGYDKYENLFLSSVYKKRKVTGELYDIVIDKMDTSPRNILHIGDNKRNDVEQALAKGIKAVFYPKVIDRFFNEHSNMREIFKDNYDYRFIEDKLSFSIILGINSIIWIENQKENYWTRMGSLYAGPFIFYFTKWIYDKACSKKIKNIALVARDGYNIKKVIKILDQSNELNPQYIYLPRFVSESSNISNTNDLENFSNELGKSYEGLHVFITEFSKENDQIKKKWEVFKNATKHLTHINLWQFVLSIKNLFIETSQKKKQLITDYLNQKNFLEDDLIIVDTSCTHARSQKLLSKIIEDNQLNISLYGYYYKVNRLHENLNQTDIRPKSKRKYQTDKWDLMEFFMSSPERPVVSVKKEGNEYLPVFKDIEDNEHEKTRIEASELLSEGIVKFTHKAHGIFGEIEIIKDLDTIVAYVNNLINNPSHKDRSHIKYLYHSANNDDNYSSLILKDEIPKEPNFYLRVKNKVLYKLKSIINSILQ